MKASELRKLIGQRVAWDDIGTRWHFVRVGVLEGVSGRNVIVNGDWKWAPGLKNLRLATEKDLEDAR